MKRILDARFRYTPSFETDIRRTFERIKRELAANGVDVDAQRARRRLERGEQAIEERRGQVAVLAFGMRGR